MEALKTDMVLWQNRIVKVEDCVGVLKKHISRGKKRQEKLGEMITAIATQKAAVEKAESEVRKIRENQKVHDPQAEMEGKTEAEQVKVLARIIAEQSAEIRQKDAAYANCSIEQNKLLAAHGAAMELANSQAAEQMSEMSRVLTMLGSTSGPKSCQI